MPARKISKMSTAYKKGVAEKKKTNIAKRQRRNQKRIEQGKKPLAQPLKIARGQERVQALKKGKMIFYDGKKRIEVPLVFTADEFGHADKKIKYLMPLQGIYKIRNEIFTARKVHKNKFLNDIILFKMRKGKEARIQSFFSLENDLAHMLIPEPTRKSSLGLKLASKAERHQRAKQKGRHEFNIWSDSQLVPLFEKLGYKLTKKKSNWIKAEKKAKFQPKDNLDKFHRIEATDKNGKTRIYTFPIRN